MHVSILCTEYTCPKTDANLKLNKEVCRRRGQRVSVECDIFYQAFSSSRISLAVLRACVQPDACRPVLKKNVYI